MRLLLLLIVTLLSTSAIQAQRSKGVSPPPAALEHLNRTYPGAEIDEWEQGGKNFKADFDLKGETYHAYYTPEGAWVRTEHDVKKSELPEAVSAALKASKYGDWKIEDVEEHATPEHARLYKVKVETEVKKAELVFTPDGALIREEVKK